MNRRILGVMGGLASAALIATALPTTAVAAPPENPQEQGSVNGKKDDRPDKLEERRRELNQRAQEMVLKGEARVQDRGGSKAVKVAPGQWAQYGLQDSDEVLSFLVEFGDKQDERASIQQTTGPLHNQIPQPDESDNSTYWEPDFDRAHYMKMFFSDEGESFKTVYEEMSSGRYTVDGDVSDWVKVDYNEGSYGYTENNTDMTRFIQDTANAWYDAQIAAGKSEEQIAEYLARFDQWDRYDHDGDGDYSEPDGYIDHFQAIHAGEGEEAGAPEWAIWSHRWAANIAGTFEVGPEGAPFGGVKIGDTDLWIRDYTTEPENGGLGVFAHEYAHDLGLPDLYDTRGGENGTGFWTLMSSGSWLGHGDGAIGTTPNHMGPWEKFQLGWLDYDVARAGQSSEHKLGPSYHATKKAQALITILPKHKVAVDLGQAAEGADYFYSGRGDYRTATVTSPSFTVPTDGQLNAQAKYAIEDDWDYAFTEISTDGGETFDQVETNLSTTTDPHGQNDGFGITGSSAGKWVDLNADLSAFAGETAQIRFRMFNDAAVNETGFLVDAISVGTAADPASALFEGAEDGAPGWELDLFEIAENGASTNEYSHYYIAENRQYLGYDSTLQTGPYNFGWLNSQPNKVEHFPYQNGLLIWYWNTQYGDNNVSQHPGGGEALPIDARPGALRFSDGAIARNRIQTFDATFGLERTDAVTLHRETATGEETLDIPSRPAVPVFHDSDELAYYDEANPRGSVKVAGSGVRITVESVTNTGQMKVLVD
ncbi:MAG TPA: immune inhibitor A domain-containing protein [Nocardioidaceae bacterium]